MPCSAPTFAAVGLHVAATGMEPVKLPDQLRSEFYAFVVDMKTTVVDLALPGNYIQVTAGGAGKEDFAIFSFNFFKTAEAALLA